MDSIFLKYWWNILQKLLTNSWHISNVTLWYETALQIYCQDFFQNMSKILQIYCWDIVNICITKILPNHCQYISNMLPRYCKHINNKTEVESVHLGKLRYCWYGQMLQGQMLLGQMSPRQSISVKRGHRKLTLKFGQNRVSNSWYIADMDKCHQDSRHLLKLISESLL